jgi:putative membrane protein
VEVVEMMGLWDQSSAWNYAVMFFGMIGAVALVVWVLVAIARSDRPHVDSSRADGSGETARAGAERILDERFARGDLDADEFHSRRADLLVQHHLADTGS